MRPAGKNTSYNEHQKGVSCKTKRQGRRQQAGNAGRGAQGNRSSGHRAIRNITLAKSIDGIKSGVSGTLTHANWDVVTNGLVYNGSDDRTLPASMYLSSKPSWWGTTAWPAIGPDVSPMYPAAPAAGTYALGRDQAALSAPSALTAQ